MVLVKKTPSVTFTFHTLQWGNPEHTMVHADMEAVSNVGQPQCLNILGQNICSVSGGGVLYCNPATCYANGGWQLGRNLYNWTGYGTELQYIELNYNGLTPLGDPRYIQIVPSDITTATTLADIFITVKDQATGAGISTASITAKNNVTLQTYVGVLQYPGLTGNYLINDVPAGLYLLTVTAPGYQLFLADPLQVTTAPLMLTVNLVPTAPPPPTNPGNLLIKLYNSITGAVIKTGIVFTDSLAAGYDPNRDGYWFPNLQAKTWTVTAQAAGYLNVITTVVIQSDLTVIRSLTMVTAPTPPPISTTFTVIIDIFDNVTAQPITGWTMSTPGLSLLTFTADNVTTSVRVTGIPEGSYTTTVSKTNYTAKSQPWTANASSVNEGTDTIHFSIMLTPGVAPPPPPPDGTQPPPSTDPLATIMQFLPFILIIGLITPLLRGGESRRD